MSQSFPIPRASGIGLTFAIAVILLASNFTIINAQQQQSQMTSQPEDLGIGTTAAAVTIFQSVNDSFSIQVPENWTAYDITNSTSALSEETGLGYGLIAQLCSQEEQRQGAEEFSNNASRSIANNSCQGAQEEVVHIVRYPDLDTRLLANNITTANNNMTIIDNIVSYQLQKLQEAGYRSMRTIASTDMAVNLTNPHTNETLATVPAKFVEITYGTNIAPNEIRRGYLLSTATNSTAPNIGTTKGYAVFYEGNSTTTNATAAIMSTPDSLPPSILIRQLFDSFELTAAPELVPAPVEQVAQPAQFTDEDAPDDNNVAVETDDGEDDGDDNGRDEDDGDDNGRDEDDGDDNGRDEDDGDDNGRDEDDGDDNGRDEDDGDDNGRDEDDGDDNGRDEDDGDDNGRDEDDCVNIGGTSCADDYDSTADD